MTESFAPTPVVDRVRLEALRYAVNDEAASYVAVMRVFTSGLTGLLSDQSAAEVAQALADQGLELEPDTVEARLSYLVEHGNLARSPRETEARSLADYLTNRARYQLTQRGELVHRHVEELLGHSDAAREVSTEMLGGILEGLRRLAAYDEEALQAAEPDTVAREIGTLFAQFDRLVHSTREFYTYLTQVLTRYDLDRGEFQAFKSALLDYLQRFIDEIQGHMPQISDALSTLVPRLPVLCARANAGARLLDLEGREARRATGLDPADWQGLRAWFVGDGPRGSDADVVRGLATQAMRALLTNLRRIARSSQRDQGRYADLTRLAGWFDSAADGDAHALWAAVFGLYPSRHLGFLADEPERRVPPTTSWWTAPQAQVPVMLRASGKRQVGGRSAVREDFTVAKTARLAERQAAERRRSHALAEVAALRGDLADVSLSDEARDEILTLYAACLALFVGPPQAPSQARFQESDTSLTVAVPLPLYPLLLSVHDTPGVGTTITSPSGRLSLVDRSLRISASDNVSGESGVL